MESVEIGSLAPDPRNARRHPDRNLKEIQRSLKRFGQQKPIVIDSASVVRAGNGTLAAAKALGWTHIDVVRSDLPAKEVAAFAVVDNRTAELAEWDDAALAELFRDAEIGDLGFDEDEIAEVLAAAPNERELGMELPVPSFNESPERVRPGEIWALDDHRLLCGDSTKPEHLLALFGDKRASMVFTDPPYNVAYEGGTAEKLTIANDDMGDAEFRQFLRDAFTAAIGVTAPGGAIYICHADSEGYNFRGSMVEAGWLLKQCLIWVKNTFTLGRQDYQWKHEPILYGWKPGRHRWYGGRKQSTAIDAGPGVTVEDEKNGHVITIDFGDRSLVLRVPKYEVIHAGDNASVIKIDKPAKNPDHPTMKPLKLPAQAIRNSSKRGEIVLDSFLGSGSTLIAAHQLGRVCYGVEMSPRYCDVIIKRWENESGRKAIKAGEVDAAAAVNV